MFYYLLKHGLRFLPELFYFLEAIRSVLRDDAMDVKFSAYINSSGLITPPL